MLSLPTKCYTYILTRDLHLSIETIRSHHKVGPCVVRYLATDSLCGHEDLYAPVKFFRTELRLFGNRSTVFSCRNCIGKNKKYTKEVKTSDKSEI